MGNTSVLWPEVEVENSGSRCAHEMQIEIKPSPETRRSAARLTEAKLGNALLETHGIQSGSRLADVFGTLLFHAVPVGSVLLLPLSVTRAPTPPGEKVRAPIRVGGRVRTPRAVFRPSPNYPPLAKQARISGDVVIDKTASVVEMKVVSAPPPLIPAALAAVRTWRYEPTYLDDEPIEIQFILTARFELQN